MTTKQREQFNRMRSVLLLIKKFQTPDQMRRGNRSEREYGIGADEAIAMAYENIQSLAERAVKGVRALDAGETK